MAFAVCALIVGGIAVFGLFPKQVAEAPVVLEVPAISSFARFAPTVLTIPKLNLETTFVEPLGLNEDQTVSIPDSYEQVGWYKYGATPGEIGSAVILGHVDSVDGPAVFFSLGQLEKGDEINVQREDGTTATFVVDDLVRYPQNAFPTEKVYGNTNTATLKLVTCTGLFNKGEQRYSHNLVVYATLKE
jgi:sortase (surface protein transpeptidase)